MIKSVRIKNYYPWLVVGILWFVSLLNYLDSIRNDAQPISHDEMLEITRLLLSLPEALRSGKSVNPQKIH